MLKKLLFLTALLLPVAALAADNFAINNATGAFTVLKSTDDGTGAQSINVVTAGGSVVGSVAASAVARGGAITAGGTAQTLMAANAARKGFSVQNPCSAAEQGIATAENLYINFTSAATVNSSVNVAVLPPCSAFGLGLTAGIVSGELISVIAATTAHIWYAKEF